MEEDRRAGAVKSSKEFIIDNIYKKYGVTEIDESTYSVLSGDGKRSYTVRFLGRRDGEYVKLWECDCPAGKFGKTTCRHIRIVAEAVSEVCDKLGLE